MAHSVRSKNEPSKFSLMICTNDFEKKLRYLLRNPLKQLAGGGGGFNQFDALK